MNIEVSTQATMEMSDAPSQSGISGTGAQMVSLYQADLIGVQCEIGINWQHIFFGLGSPSVPDGAVFMTVNY